APHLETVAFQRAPRLRDEGAGAGARGTPRFGGHGIVRSLRVVMRDRRGGSEGAQARRLAVQRGLRHWDPRLHGTARSQGGYDQAGEACPSFEGLPSYPWPTFVDAGRIREWARMSLAMRRLIVQEAVSWIDSDARAIADLFGSPLRRASMVARLLG